MQRLNGGLVVLQLLGHLLVLLQKGLHVPCTQRHSLIKMIIFASPLNLEKKTRVADPDPYVFGASWIRIC
jgi:hypothetical protein